MHGERNSTNDDEEGADDNEEENPELWDIRRGLQAELCPYPHVVFGIWAVKLGNFFSMRYSIDLSRVETKLIHHFMAFDS